MSGLAPSSDNNNQAFTGLARVCVCVYRCANSQDHKFLRDHRCFITCMIRPPWQILCFANSTAQLFVGLAYQGKDIVFRFIIEYSSLRDFGPLVIGLFLCEDFWKMIFRLVLKIEISYRVIIALKNLFSFRWFFEDYIFAWWNIWVSIILLSPQDTL